MQSSLCLACIVSEMKDIHRHLQENRNRDNQVINPQTVSSLGQSVNRDYLKYSNDNNKKKDLKPKEANSPLTLRLSGRGKNESSVKPPRYIRGMLITDTPTDTHTASLVEAGSDVHKEMISEMKSTLQLWTWGKSITQKWVIHMA